MQIINHFLESALILDDLVRNFGISDMIVVEAVLPHQFHPLYVEALRRNRIAFICHSIFTPEITAICRLPKVNLSEVDTRMLPEANSTPKYLCGMIFKGFPARLRLLC